jgi:U1 zinc finger
MQKTDKTIYCKYCQSFWKRKSDFTNHCKTAKHLKNISMFSEEIKSKEDDNSSSPITEVQTIIKEIVTIIEKIPSPKIETVDIEKNILSPNEENLPVQIEYNNNQKAAIVEEDKNEESTGFIKFICTQIINLIKRSIFLIPGVNVILGNNYQRYKNN